MRPAISSGFCAHGSVAGSFSSNRPKGAINASRLILSDQIAAGQIRLVDEIADREQPVEMAVEYRVSAVAAGKARERRDDYRAGLGQAIEERDPARKPAIAGKESNPGPG